MSPGWPVSGQFFRVSVPKVPNPPFVNDCFLVNTNCSNRPGILIDVFKWLANELEIEYEFLFPTVGTYGKVDENGTWTGTIGQLANGEADMTGIGIFITNARAQVVEYMPVIRHNLSPYGFLVKV